MKLESCKRIAYGKCARPEDTIKRLEAAIGARYEYRYIEQKVSDYLYWSALLIDDLAFRSMGKGVNPIMCKAGALAEAAEWVAARDLEKMPGYMLAHQKDVQDPLKIEDLLTHIATATPKVIEKIKNVDCAQYWVDGYSLMSGKTLKVPVEYTRVISGPSGLAAGNRLEETIVHCLDEIFERRTHITVLKNRMVVPTIDIETIENPVIRSQIDFVQSKGIEVYLKDLSFGGELPCIGAYFKDHNVPDNFQMHHFFKVGTSFNMEDALIRTFTEYAQGRRLDEFINGTKEEQIKLIQHDFRSMECMKDEGDNFLSAFMFGFVPYKNTDFLKEGELVPFNKGDIFEDCLQDIEKAKGIIRKLGKDCVVVDFTDPEIGFPVAQVVIPGYSDILPYHPKRSNVLFKEWKRDDVLNSYDKTSILDCV